MGKKSSPAPPAPVQIDPWETAESQYEFGKKTALYNKQLQESTFQQTPYGTLRYENITPEASTPTPMHVTDLANETFGRGSFPSDFIKGIFGPAPPTELSIPITKMIQELHPAEQALLDQQRSLKGQYGDLAGQLMSKTEKMYSSPIDMSRLGPMSTTGQAGSQEAIQEIIDRYQPRQSLGMGDMPIADQASRQDFSMGDMPIADQATRQSIIDSTMERFRPQQTSDRAALETRLANQGFTYGATGWKSAMDEINRRENDFRLATNQFAGGEMRADLAQQLGMREQGFQEKLQTENQRRADLAQQLSSNLQMENQRRADLAQQLGIRQQSLQELLLPRNQTLQELSTFMTGSAPTMPQFGSINAPQVNAPDYAGLAMSNAQMQNQANMNAYQAQMANQGPGLGSIVGTLGGAFLGGPGGAALGGKIGGWAMGE